MTLLGFLSVFAITLVAAFLTISIGTLVLL